MPPRTYRDLTPEQLAELQAEMTPHAAVPRLPAGALASTAPAAGPAPWQVSMGGLRFLDSGDAGDDIERGGLALDDGQGGDPDTNAWLDELIGRPPSTPPQRMVSAAAPNGSKFTGEDTPESRDLIKQRGMQVTEQSPPSDDELLNALTSDRQASMPDLGGDQGWLDDLIAREGAVMDREQRPAAQAPAQPPRRSREDIVSETLQPPTRAQGWLSVLSDALFGGNSVDNVNARARDYQGALGQARMHDVQAAEHADDQAAQREMLGRRLDLTERGQDLAQQRADENQSLRWLLGQQADQRQRELTTQREGGAMNRAELMAHAHADAGAPDVTPEQKTAGLAGFLMQQVNGVPLAKVRGYLEGDREGIAPDKLEQLDATLGQWQIASPKTQQSMLGKGVGREGATPDQTAASIERKQLDPKARLEIRTGIDETGRDIARAASAWSKMSDKAKKAFATFVPEGDFSAAVRQGLMTPQEQKYASDVQALANGLVKARAGSAVTGSEWKRVASEIGFPMNDWAVFNSPEVIDNWISRAKQGWVARVKNTRSEYGDLWGGNAGP